MATFDYFERGMEEHASLICFLCKEPINTKQLKKSSYLQVGDTRKEGDNRLDLRVAGHDACIAELLDTTREAEREEREAWEAVDTARELSRAVQKAVKTENLMRKHYVHE